MWVRAASAAIFVMGGMAGAAYSQANNVVISGHGETWGFNGQDHKNYAWPITGSTSNAGEAVSAISASITPFVLDLTVEADAHVVGAHSDGKIIADFDLSQSTVYDLGMAGGVNGGQVILDGDIHNLVSPYNFHFVGTLVAGHHTYSTFLGVNGVASNNSIESILTLAPEPSSLGLLILGASALIRRRRPG